MYETRLVLLEPTLADKAAVLSFRKVFAGHNTAGEIPGAVALATAESYEAWLERVKLYANKASVPAGMVLATTYLARRRTDMKLVGIVQIRHELNEHLRRIGGHIGYAVAPDERRKGYGTEILRLGLRHCKTLGLGRVLVTCDKTNLASAAVIRANDGVLENEVNDNGIIKQRYWITPA
jgi:predicted acetyltransferase